MYRVFHAEPGVKLNVNCQKWMVNGELSKYENPKTEMLEDILEQTTEKVVIFSFYLCSMKYLTNFLNERKIKFYEISGRTQDTASSIIADFAKDKG